MKRPATILRMTILLALFDPMTCEAAPFVQRSHGALAVLQEATNRRVAFETDGDHVRMPRLRKLVGLRQELRARGPVRLVFREPLVCDLFERLEPRSWSPELRDDERAIDRH